jgi:hypothetical protein
MATSWPTVIPSWVELGSAFPCLRAGLPRVEPPSRQNADIRLFINPFSGRRYHR